MFDREALSSGQWWPWMGTALQDKLHLMVWSLMLGFWRWQHRCFTYATLAVSHLVIWVSWP